MFYIVGASIGANAAFDYAEEDVTINKLVLLSPGLDYGITIEQTEVTRFGRPILILVSQQDEYAATSSNQITAWAGSNSQLEVYPGTAHETEMFASTDALAKIIAFLGN